jgi:hypothetical protein
MQEVHVMFRAAYGVRCSVLMLFRTAGGAGVPYAGPDRTDSLPHPDALTQFLVTWQSSHLECLAGFPGMAPQPSGARLQYCAPKHAGRA